MDLGGVTDTGIGPGPDFGIHYQELPNLIRKLLVGEEHLVHTQDRYPRTRMMGGRTDVDIPTISPLCVDFHNIAIAKFNFWLYGQTIVTHRRHLK